jgi:acetoacetyl-CoA synthetase
MSVDTNVSLSSADPYISTLDKAYYGSTNGRKNCSPRHVPSKVIAIEDIPYTINMKKVEIAVMKIIHGQPVLNRDALKNPESLDLFRNIPDLKV